MMQHLTRRGRISTRSKVNVTEGVRNVETQLGEEEYQQGRGGR